MSAANVTLYFYQNEDEIDGVYEGNTWLQCSKYDFWVRASFK